MIQGASRKKKSAGYNWTRCVTVGGHGIWANSDLGQGEWEWVVGGSDGGEGTNEKLTNKLE